MTPTKYWFSKSRTLWCREAPDGSYWVINGGWSGIRDGDEFLVAYTGRVLIVKDWIHVTKAELVEMGWDCEYIPSDPTAEELERRSELMATFDDDIAF